MYALVEILGKQYKAEAGKTLRIDFLGDDKTAGTAMEFDSVLLFAKEGNVSVGKPFVEGAKVKVILLDHTLGEKVVNYKYKRRKDYERKVGHRQDYSMVKVEEIIGA
jgi:large subunit ribosomal protein L21